MEKRLNIPESLQDKGLDKVISSLDRIVHLSFGSKRKGVIEDEIVSFVDAWEASGLGVGPKVHIIQHHLVPSLAALEGEEGLGIWSEQASESAHSAFAGLVSRYCGQGEIGMLKHALVEYNYTRM